MSAQSEPLSSGGVYQGGGVVEVGSSRGVRL